MFSDKEIKIIRNALSLLVKLRMGDFYVEELIKKINSKDLK